MVEINGQNLISPVQIPKATELQNNNELAAKDTSSDFVVEKLNPEPLELEDPELKELNKKPLNVSDQEKQSTTQKDPLDSLQKFFNDGPPWFQAFRDHFVTALNTVGISLNVFTVVANHANIMPEPVANYLDKAAEWYSRYVVSLGFGWNGIESLVGKRPIEALSRFLPTMGFMALPFYNFNLATGISSFMSYVFDKVVQRNGGEQPGIGSAMENTMGMMKHTLGIFQDFLNPKSQESLVEKIGIAGLGIGTVGGLAFAAKERDSFAARLFGNMRNIGGLVADYELVFNKDKDWRGPHKRLVGLTCSTASILNIIARWVDPELGRVLNHLSIAADDLGLTYWAQMSKKDNDAAQGKDLNPKDRREVLKQEAEAKAKELEPLIELSKPVETKTSNSEQAFAQAA